MNGPQPALPPVPHAVPRGLALSPALGQAMLDHVRACLPEEACGLLGGRVVDGLVQVETLLPVENILHSPVRFTMNPAEMLRGFDAFEAAGLALVAYFHSHPTGPNHLSPTDRAEFAYPGVLAVILAPRGAAVPRYPQPARKKATGPLPAGSAALGDWEICAYHIHTVLDPLARVSPVPLIWPPQPADTNGCVH